MGHEVRGRGIQTTTTQVQTYRRGTRTMTQPMHTEMGQKHRRQGAGAYVWYEGGGKRAICYVPELK